MDAQTLIGLAQRVADVGESTGEPVARVEMGEMGDGSRRLYALVYTTDEINGFEQQVRISSPAPWNAPAWASIYTDWRYEISTGSDWMKLEVEFAATREP